MGRRQVSWVLAGLAAGCAATFTGCSSSTGAATNAAGGADGGAGRSEAGSGTGSPGDAGGGADGAACDPSPPSCVPPNADCAGSQYCCQTGAGLPVGAGCAGVTGTCVPRCNSGADCAAGSCCVGNSSSVPAPGYPPGEPGGWCLPETEVAAIGGVCTSGYGNGYICEGTFTCGYVCAPATDAGLSPAPGQDAGQGPPEPGTDAGAAGDGGAVSYPACDQATTDTIVEEGLGKFTSSGLGDDAPNPVDVESGQVASVEVTSSAGNNTSLTVQLSYLVSPYLQTGTTYPLTGSTYSPGNTLMPVPLVAITAPDGSKCEVGGGQVTLNKLVVGAGGYVQEAEASWTGMTCVRDMFDNSGAAITATGPGCFHVF